MMKTEFYVVFDPEDPGGEEPRIYTDLEEANTQAITWAQDSGFALPAIGLVHIIGRVEFTVKATDP